MRLAVVACFLNEQEYLPIFLASLESQERTPDQLILVDDGSYDDSPQLSAQFAEKHPYARAVSRPRRPPARDRLARAAELEAFCWGMEHLSPDWDVVVKLDADLRLSPDMFAEVERRFEADPGLGMAGADLDTYAPDGSVVPERCPPDHVRGSNKFYLRACFEQVFPLEFRLGWDTIDEVRARIHGWRTQSFAMPAGNPIHMRPTATHDGAARGFRRNGTAAYAYGAGFWWVLLGAVRRMAYRPLVFGGINYVLGWLLAAARRYPRAAPAERAFQAREHRLRIRAMLTRRAAI